MYGTARGSARRPRPCRCGNPARIRHRRGSSRARSSSPITSTTCVAPSRSALPRASRSRSAAPGRASPDRRSGPGHRRRRAVRSDPRARPGATDRARRAWRRTGRSGDPGTHRRPVPRHGHGSRDARNDRRDGRQRLGGMRSSKGAPRTAFAGSASCSLMGAGDWLASGLFPISKAYSPLRERSTTTLPARSPIAGHACSAASTATTCQPSRGLLPTSRGSSAAARARS